MEKENLIILTAKSNGQSWNETIKNLDLSHKSTSRLSAITKKEIRYKEIVKVAQLLKFRVSGGHGRHGVHLETPDGKHSMPLVVHGHGKSLSPGYQRHLILFLTEHSQRKEISNEAA